MRLNDVTKRFGAVCALQDVSCAIASGSFTVIIGPSGCGKSTLLRAIAGLDSIDDGELYIDGQLANNMPTRDRACSMVFQDYALYPHMSVAGNIAYPLKLSGLSSREREIRISEIASLLDIANLLHRRPTELSGGQRQRAAIARAIARRPKILLLDEPLSNLDARLRADTRAEFRRLHRELGMTVIHVTHDYVEAMTLADEIYVMEHGRIIQSGASRAIYSRPATTSIAMSFGSPRMNLISAVATANGGLSVADSQYIQCPSFPFEEGTEIVVGIRPEHLSLSSEPSDLSLVCTDIEDRGNARVLRGRLGAHSLTLLVSTESEYKPDQTIFVAVDTSSLLFFDSGTGTLVGTVGDFEEHHRHSIPHHRSLIPRSPRCFSGKFGGSTPDCVGRKFTSDGSVLDFPGNTVLFPMNENDAIVSSLKSVSNMLQRVPQAQHFAFLPSDTFHITLLDCVEYGNVRRQFGEQNKFCGLDGAQMSVMFQKAVRGYSVPSSIRMTPVCVGPSKSGGLLLYVEGARQHDEFALRQIRDNLSELFGVRRKGHDAYLFHVTLAYQLNWLSSSDAVELTSLCQKLSKHVLTEIPEFAIGPPEISEFSDMCNYQTVEKLPDRAPLK